MGILFLRLLAILSNLNLAMLVSVMNLDLSANIWNVSSLVPYLKKMNVLIRA